jgi:hypothetical protein
MSASRVRHALSYKDARTYLRIGITPVEIVRLRWPDITDQGADYVLWELTPFPLVRGVHDLADAVCAIEEEPPGLPPRAPRSKVVAA